MKTGGLVLLLLTILLSACAETPDSGARPGFGDGNRGTGLGTSSTLAGATGNVGCVAASASPVQSGEPFLVQVSLTRGTLPYSVVGFTDGVDGKVVTIEGTITISGSAVQTLSRTLTVRDATGETGTCSFRVAVYP
jgi:hypothetical protein